MKKIFKLGPSTPNCSCWMNFVCKCLGQAKAQQEGTNTSSVVASVPSHQVPVHHGALTQGSPEVGKWKCYDKTPGRGHSQSSPSVQSPFQNSTAVCSVMLLSAVVFSQEILSGKEELDKLINRLLEFAEMEALTEYLENLQSVEGGGC